MASAPYYLPTVGEKMTSFRIAIARSLPCMLRLPFDVILFTPLDTYPPAVIALMFIVLYLFQWFKLEKR
jgi:hypothetical protein